MRQTDEELSLVKEYLELPFLLDILELDKKKMTDSNMKMGLLYIEKLSQIQNLVTAKLYEVRKKLRNGGIKVIEQIKEDDRMVADYLCRGYRHQITLLWSKVKFDTEVSLAKYLGIDIFDAKKE